MLVEMQSEEEVSIVKSTVRKVRKVLSKIPTLDYLHISLEGRGWFDAQPLYRVLGNFALLRNVQSVVLDGVLPAYAQFLECKMAGISPLNLSRMYDALEFYASPFDFCEDNLQKACDAAEEDDIERFQHVRAEIITVVTERMSNARSHLFDHDF